MNMRRTPAIYYLLAVGLGLIGGVCFTQANERWRLNMLGAPWLVSALLLILGLIILAMTYQVHRYAKGERKEMDSQFAVNALLLAKALGIACSALLGWYGGQALMSLTHKEAPYYERVIVECAIAAVVCLVDIAIGVVGEWLCQLPPKDGPESPQQRQQAQQRRLAGAAEKQMPKLSEKDPRKKRG
ncbi:membrane protein [Bombiscardovia nodaiensis]|uniref:Membrane protein n=1 Tax=Bombiscardovia nodaiensis TaxID=2932181 RepID=A0ABM8B7D5_9BIFI|nr:membrane protein [Bombiscardovia nodaiensis]